MQKLEATPNELAQLARDCRLANLRLAVWGPPGVGKSKILQDLAVELNLNFIDTRLAYSAPTDVKGYPIVQEDEFGNPRMKFAIGNEFPKTPGNLWALEEFPCAPKQTANCSLELLLENRIGEYQVPDDTFICLTGNRPEDRAFVEKLSPAVINRLIIVTLKTHLPDWEDWAVRNRIDPTVIAFIKFRPELLHQFEGPDWDGASPFPSPRSWEFVSKIVGTTGTGNGSRSRSLLVNGCVGSGAAAEYEGFLQIYQQLPRIELALSKPKEAPIPQETSARFAMVAALATRIDKKNLKNGLTYLGRFPKEFEVFCVKMIFKRDSSICESVDFVNWVKANNDVFVDA